MVRTSLLPCRPSNSLTCLILIMCRQCARLSLIVPHRMVFMDRYSQCASDCRGVAQCIHMAWVWLASGKCRGRSAEAGEASIDRALSVLLAGSSISGLTYDHPSSVAHQQRKEPDPRPPQAAGALKIALLGAHGKHGPRGALEELDQSMLLLRHLSVLCSSHVQAIPRPCRGIEQRLYSPMHIEIIGPQIPFCATRSTRAERSVGT